MYILLFNRNVNRPNCILDNPIFRLDMKLHVPV